MAKRKYRTRETCKFYKESKIVSKECWAKLSTWKCCGITSCLEWGGWYKEKSK